MEFMCQESTSDHGFESTASPETSHNNNNDECKIGKLNFNIFLEMRLNI